MSKSRQLEEAPLNGAYYALPTTPVVRPPRRARDLCTFRNLAAAVVVVTAALGVTAVVLGLALRPREIKVYAVRASMTQFKLTGGGGDNLDYNLSLLLVVRNPNRRVGVFYDWLDATAYYEGRRFGWASLPPFYQRQKNVTTIEPVVFVGRSIVVLGDSGMENYYREQREGYFDVRVWIYARLRFVFGSWKSGHHWARMRCDLERVPLLLGNGSSGVGFSSTRCDVDM